MAVGTASLADGSAAERGARPPTTISSRPVQADASTAAFAERERRQRPPRAGRGRVPEHVGATKLVAAPGGTGEVFAAGPRPRTCRSSRGGRQRLPRFGPCHPGRRRGRRSPGRRRRAVPLCRTVVPGPAGSQHQGECADDEPRGTSTARSPSFACVECRIACSRRNSAGSPITPGHRLPADRWRTGSVESRLVILSDRSIKEALAAERIVIDPIDERDVQPSSVDLHIDRYFRVFRNDTTPYIDPKQPAGGPHRDRRGQRRRRVHPPPRRVRARLDLRARRAARRPRRPARGQVLARSPRSPHPQHRGLRRRGLGRAPHARAVERRDAADRALPADEDRADLVLRDDDAGRAPVRQRRRRARSTRASAARRRAATTSTSATTTSEPRARPLRVGGHRPGDGRLPRRRVGRPAARRPPALREDLARRARRPVSRGRRSCASARATGRAFAGFDPAKVARFTPAKVERLLLDPGHRAQPGEDRVDDRRTPRRCSRCSGSSAASTRTSGRSSTARRS